MLVLNKPSWCRFLNLINKSSMDGYRGSINNLTLDLEREGKKKEQDEMRYVYPPKMK
jgi:hypothetical protein